MYHFTEDCLIGVDMIDNEHRELFRIINEIDSLLRHELIEDKYDRIQILLKELKDYAEYHFAHEEKYMEKIRHPELELQKKQHTEFSCKINEADMLSDNPNQEAFLDDLLKYLVTWLYRHIIGSDLMIGKLAPMQKEKEAVGCSFTDEYLTGISFIDEEHKELFRLIGEVNRIIADEFIPDKYDEIVYLLQELKDYTEFHFGDEEKYMEEIGYAGLPAQKRAHEAFVARLENMNLEQIDDNQKEALEEILEFLTEWLVNHILHSDKKIGA